MKIKQIYELIKEGDLNFNCCAYDVHEQKIVNSEYIKEISSKLLKFTNDEKPFKDPTITINALKQISKLPEIQIPDETNFVIQKTIPLVYKFLESNQQYKYLLFPIFSNINSAEALEYLGSEKERFFKNSKIKKERLNISSKYFHSEEIKNISTSKMLEFYNLVKNAYKNKFDHCKFFNSSSNSVVWKETQDGILSCAIIDNERVYSAAANNRFEWILLISEIIKNNYNSWAIIDSEDLKIRALCKLAGWYEEKNPQIIRKILKNQSGKYGKVDILKNNTGTIFKKGGLGENKSQILVRS